MKPRWRKVLHDLVDNKGRTLLVVFSIAVGVFSIGVIAGTYQIISNDMSISYAANQPANVEMRMTDFDDNILSVIRNQRDVKNAEARRVFNIRVRVPGTDKWTTLDMIAFDSFEDNTINLLKPIDGATVPKKHEILLEKDALEDLNVELGSLLEFQLPDGTTKTLPVVGFVQDTAAGAGDFLADPFAYEILVVRDAAARRDLAHAALGQEFLSQVPVVLVFFAHPDRSGAKYRQRGVGLYSVQDATIACTYAQLAATALGLGTVWVGAFDDNAVVKALGTKPEWRPVALLPIGYAAESPPATPRRNLSDLVHHHAR